MAEDTHQLDPYKMFFLYNTMDISQVFNKMIQVAAVLPSQSFIATRVA